MSHNPTSQPIFSCLSQTNAELETKVELYSGMSAAIWNRSANDFTRYQQPGHHTLSCYLSGGQDIRRLYRQRTLSGGAPGRICLMPSQHDSDWDIAGSIRFMHLYFSEENLRAMAGRIQDKGSDHVELQDLTFLEDPWLKSICQQVMMPLNWQDNADQLALSSASDMLLIHMLKHYCTNYISLPNTKGGLAPYIQKQLTDYIEAHLDQALTLQQLAKFAQLSEYYFARMFKVSFGMPPHQYVHQRRLTLAALLLTKHQHSLTDIALRCGFSNQSHFSNRFKQFYNVTPSAYRKSHTHV